MIVYFDGDDVSSALELLLLNGDAEGARTYSESLLQASSAIRAHLSAVTGAEIILAGGDDLVVRLPGESIPVSVSGLIDRLRRDYRSTCGKTLSVGVGCDTREAVLNLRRAKLMGGNRVEGICSPGAA